MDNPLPLQKTKDMELQQQFENPKFIMGLNNGQINVDPMTQCLHRAIFNQIKHPELGIQYGMLLVWDNQVKHYDPFWGWHCWNVSEDETIIYDNLDIVQQGITHFEYKLKNPINNWKIKVIDGSNIKTNAGYDNCFSILDKITKPHKGYDAIYLQNFGFAPDRKTQITWEDFNDNCDQVEDYLTTMLEISNETNSNVIDLVNNLNENKLQSFKEKRESELRKQFPNVKEVFVF